MNSRSVDSQPPEAAWTEVERELLGAAREERMPAELEARMRDALAFAEMPSGASAETAPRATFNDTARARQLFAGKLPLWGMLGIVALSAISYYTLTRTTSQPTAAPAQVAATLEAPASAQALTQESAVAQREATKKEAPSAQHNVISPAPASAQRAGVGSTSADARRDAASAQRDGSGSAHESTQAGTRREAASAQRDEVGSASASAQAGAPRAIASAQRGGFGSASASAQVGAQRDAASTQRDGSGSLHESTQADARRDAASARHDGSGSATASAQAGASRETASAQRDGMNSMSTSAEAGARRDAASPPRDVAGRDVASDRSAVRHRAADAERDAASAKREGAARGSERRRSDVSVAPPLAAENDAAQASRSDVGPARKASDVGAAQSGMVATPDQLRLEAQLLEHARSALGHGALPEARQWLARYQTQFARGALQPESQVLGIELAVRTGAQSTAKAQAAHFLAQHPHHPLRDRVQLLTEEPR